MSSIKTAIVEDEAPARARLLRYLRPHRDVEVVGEAATGFQAIALIERTSPDLIFLDINLPDVSAFEVLERIGDNPYVIFATAYDEYAVRAFEVDALDFLVKPYEQERVDKAIERARSAIKLAKGQVMRSEGDSAAESPGWHQGRIVLHDKECRLLASLSEIYYFNACGDTVYARLAGKRPIVRRSLRQLEEQLERRRFFRANRSALVNLDLVREIHPWFGGRRVIRFLRLEPREQIEVSRRQAQRLDEILNH